MPRFAANLSLMFGEWDFLDRFKAAADAGFTAVEFLYPYEHPPEKVSLALSGAGLELALFNLPPGDLARGERGLAALPGRESELAASLELALPYVKATGVERLHMLAGTADSQDPAAQNAFRAAIAYAAEKLLPHGVDLMVEPINQTDMPGYFLHDFDVAATYVREAGFPNVKLQFDMYHCELIHGDVSGWLRSLFALIGHVQIASADGRHEPDATGPDYPALFAELDGLGYAGFIGCEYRPRAGTLEGLGWFNQWKKRV